MQEADEGEFYVCPECGSEHVHYVGGDWTMHIGRGMIHEQFWRCEDCEHFWRIEDEE
jgi:transposase-like protein